MLQPHTCRSQVPHMGSSPMMNLWLASGTAKVNKLYRVLLCTVSNRPSGMQRTIRPMTDMPGHHSIVPQPHSPSGHGTILYRPTCLSWYHVALAHPYAMIPYCVSPPVCHSPILSAHSTYPTGPLVCCRAILHWPTRPSRYHIALAHPYASVPYCIGPPVCRGTILHRPTHMPRYHIVLAHLYAVVPSCVSPPIRHGTMFYQPTSMQ